MKAPRYIEEVGVVGSLFAVACCLGVSAVVSVVTAIGLGFLLRDAILLPLAIVFLALTVWGLAAGWRRHHNVAPLAIGIAAALAILVSAFVVHVRAAAFGSVGVLIAATILDVVLRMRRSRSVA